jgi:GNAT superfamily N-acetyltransferase
MAAVNSADPQARTGGDSLPIAAFGREHLDGAVALFAAEGWGEYSHDPERTYKALTAPGSTTLVALDGPRVVAIIQVQSDGVIQAHLSAVLVAEEWRAAGLGRRLLREGLARAGGIQIDIRTRAESYYQRLGATQSAGFRLTRSDLDLPTA